MGDIKIHRYEDPDIKDMYSGYIEPEDRSWVIFLDEDGKPTLYWAERDAFGGVVGKPIQL